MAKVANPRKVFNFRIMIAGFNEYQCQKITLPDVEIDATKHGDTNYDIKTAGRVTFGDMEMEKLSPLPAPDMLMFQWLMLAQNALLGGGVLPIAYKQIISVVEMDTTGLIPINTWVCEGVWVRKIAGVVLDRMSSDNVIEKVTFSVDRCYKV